MAAFAKGSVVLVPFPFSNLTQTKLRPAVILSSIDREDYILCQVTSNPYTDAKSIELTEESFYEGSLQRISYARPGKLFTASEELFVSRIGRLETEVVALIIDSTVNLLRKKD